MKVFLTGASGYIGTHLTRDLIAQGHSVTGLVRSAASAAVVSKNGGTPVLGSGVPKTDLPLIVEQAKAHDATYHLAFDHTFTDFLGACADERAVIEAVGAAYEGTEKLLVMTSGTLLGAHISPFTEADSSAGSHNPRAATEATAEAWAAKGNRVAIVRLPPITHGGDLGHGGFIHRIIRAAREGGAAAVIGDGGNRWPAVQVEDAVVVYRGALRAQPGKILRLHPIADEGNKVADIMGLIAQHEGIEVKSVTPEQAVAQFGFIGHLLGLDNLVTSKITQETLGWKPTQPGLLDALRAGKYFDTA